MAKILVVGGTRFFGIPMVNALIEASCRSQHRWSC